MILCYITDSVTGISKTNDAVALRRYVVESKRLIKLLANYDEDELLAQLEKYKTQAEDMRKQLAAPNADIGCK